MAAAHSAEVPTPCIVSLPSRLADSATPREAWRGKLFADRHGGEGGPQKGSAWRHRRPCLACRPSPPCQTIRKAPKGSAGWTAAARSWKTAWGFHREKAEFYPKKAAAIGAKLFDGNLACRRAQWKRLNRPALQGRDLPVRAERLHHALGRDHNREKKREREQDIQRDPRHIHPEVAHRRFSFCGSAPGSAHTARQCPPRRTRSFAR